MTRPTLDAMADEIYEILKLADPVDQEEFKTCKIEDLISYHHSLGRSIRNHFKLWQYEWKTHIVSGIDCSEDHPDNISMQVIIEVWKKLQ